MSTVLDAVSAVLLLSGAALGLVAAIGLHRLGDLYSRMHAATKPATLGIALCLSGAALQLDDVPSWTKIVLAIAFQLITAPVSAHMLARAASRRGEPVDR
jgi:multicomponent Na+:H+ antiporter subunit G